EVSGECERPGTLALDDLLHGIAPTERINRLRCVEGWSMVVPWLGVPLGDVLRKFAPTSKAKYVAFTSLADPVQLPGVRFRSIDWPYREGLRIDEAMHPLAFLATGLYGKPLPQQNGAPLRLVVPWTYGLKILKSIVASRFTERMPPTAWNRLQPREYGFYSNVNPDVDHPRWSQKTERRIAGTGNRLRADRIPTLPFNGYGEQVAALYAGMDLRKWYCAGALPRPPGKAAASFPRSPRPRRSSRPRPSSTCSRWRRCRCWPGERGWWRAASTSMHSDRTRWPRSSTNWDSGRCGCCC